MSTVDFSQLPPTPAKTRTSLVREVHRQAVTKYTMHPMIANYIVIETIIPSNIGGFWIREMGIIADNVLISHGSHAPFFKVADPDGVSEYRLKFTQNVRDGNVVEISLDESLIYASQAWVNENYIRRNEVVDNLTTDDAKKPVSAKQAKVLNENKLNRTHSLGQKFNLSRRDFDGIHTEYTWLNGPNGNIAGTLFFNYSNDWIGKVFFDITDNRMFAQSFQGGVAATPWRAIAYIDDNVASSTKLKTPRKINNIDFDGTQDINIEAPLRWVGSISTLGELNAAVLDGKYTVGELGVAGLYGYGFLVVLRSGGICHQIYYPHLGSSVNNATMAMRQSWNVNGDIATWSDWRVIGTRDDSKLPLTGGTVTGDLHVKGVSHVGPVHSTGVILIDAAEAEFRHSLSGRYLYINGEGWGVYSPQGHVALSTLGGGTGNFEGRAPSADRLATPRNIFGQTFWH